MERSTGMKVCLGVLCCPKKLYQKVLQPFKQLWHTVKERVGGRRGEAVGGGGGLQLQMISNKTLLFVEDSSYKIPTDVWRIESVICLHIVKFTILDHVKKFKLHLKSKV